MAINSPASMASSFASRPSCRLLSSPPSWHRAENGRRLSFRLQRASSVLFFRAPLEHLRPFSQQCKFRGVVCEAKEASVTESTWKTMVLESDVPVLVEFWAPWCGSCRKTELTLQELEKEYCGRLRSIRINTDDNPQIATDYGVQSIPTVVLFRDGEKKESVIGAVPKSLMVKILGKYLIS